MRLLITGASGFLGGELVRQAVSRGVRVKALVRRGSAPRGVETERADLADEAGLAAAVQGVDQVIHAAGLAHVTNPRAALANSFFDVNKRGTANVVRAAARAGVSHFVLVSSVAVYGEGDEARTEASACVPSGPYAQSKWQAELRALEIAHKHGMRLTILRLATLYGEGDPGNVARLMRWIDRGRFFWIGDGSNMKSLVHRDDAARACLAALEAPGGGTSIYNVSAAPCTMRSVVEGLATTLGRNLPRWRIPGSLAQGVADVAGRLPGRAGRVRAMAGSVRKWLSNDVYSADKLRTATGFEPSVSLDEGLLREAAWYRDSGLDWTPTIALGAPPLRMDVSAVKSTGRVRRAS